MTPIIHIPEPCHQNWNGMHPAGNGRHCSACCKTVIDFTTWEPGAIANYLADPLNKKTCGRFHKTQLESPLPGSASEWSERICQSSLSGIRKIAAVIIVVFSIMGTGCQKPMVHQSVDHISHNELDITVGEIEPIELIGDTELIQGTDSLPVCSKDTVAEPDRTMGTPEKIVEDNAE